MSTAKDKKDESAKKRKRANDQKYRKRHYKKYKEYCRKYANNYYHKNKRRIKRLNKKHILKVKYGLTVEEFNLLFDKQNGQCAICGEHQSELKKPLAVDHCHRTKKVRGLLCVRCNMALGGLKVDDGLDLIYKVLDYLK